MESLLSIDMLVAILGSLIVILLVFIGAQLVLIKGLLSIIANNLYRIRELFEGRG